MLDIKLKNSKKTRITIIVTALCIISLVNVLFFPQICSRSLGKYQKELETEKELNTNRLHEIYEGIAVLHVELSDSSSSMEQLITTSYMSHNLVSKLKVQFENIYSQIADSFRECCNNIDYYAENGTYTQWNGSNNLSVFADSEYVYGSSRLEDKYRNLWVLEFDEDGELIIDIIKSEDVAPASLDKELKSLKKEHAHAKRFLEDEYEGFFWKATKGESLFRNRINPVANLTVVFGIPKESPFSLSYANVFSEQDLFKVVKKEAVLLFLLSAAIISLFVRIMESPKVWKDLSLQKKRKEYRLEAAAIGILLWSTCYSGYCASIFQVEKRHLNTLLHYIQNNRKESAEYVAYLGMMVICYLVFSYIYILFTAICPIFSVGAKGYIKEYSYTYGKIADIKAYIEKIKRNLETFDLKNKGSGMIFKLVLINTLIIILMSCFGSGGILLAFVYSVIVFLVINNYYKELKNNYKNLITIANRIAEGDLDIEITEKLGIFEQARNELEKIQSGFKKAVEKEVKSQRMKTELITNVSHDLKTPLTAITTYVELLKKENITEEEQKSYIKTLEEKSARMKSLIEDLFELSKTNSNDIMLNLIQVDLVNLMKQVYVEHRETYEKQGLKFCWNIPEEKVELMLDNQRTYRIFENLFLNIEKYAMQNSRVYIEVTESEECILVVIKNMSAEELHIAPEELTERFVRGDASRNTEGSGLGLAIAKSLTEAQKGRFEVAVDGDLFKTIICWKKE
uniref:sensor histidine kinase n=1 Tax=Agathobacter sp. TaxID=2021311 RepID=UPI004055B840